MESAGDAGLGSDPGEEVNFMNFGSMNAGKSSEQLSRVVPSEFWFERSSKTPKDEKEPTLVPVVLPFQFGLSGVERRVSCVSVIAARHQGHAPGLQGAWLAEMPVSGATRSQAFGTVGTGEVAQSRGSVRPESFLSTLN